MVETGGAVTSTVAMVGARLNLSANEPVSTTASRLLADFPRAYQSRFHSVTRSVANEAQHHTRHLNAAAVSATPPWGCSFPFRATLAIAPIREWTRRRRPNQLLCSPAGEFSDSEVRECRDMVVLSPHQWISSQKTVDDRWILRLNDRDPFPMRIRVAQDQHGRPTCLHEVPVHPWYFHFT